MGARRLEAQELAGHLTGDMLIPKVPIGQAHAPSNRAETIGGLRVCGAACLFWAFAF